MTLNNYEKQLLPVMTMASGLTVQLGIHILHGKAEGPRILLMAGEEGDELYSVELMRHLLEQLEVNKLGGTLTAVPVMNPLAFEWGEPRSRHDGYSLRGCFPGSASGTATQRLAAKLGELIQQADAVVVLTSGGPYCGEWFTQLGSAEGEKAEISKQLANVLGLPIRETPVHTGNAVQYALDLGKPAISVHFGGGMYIDPAAEAEVKQALCAMLYANDLSCPECTRAAAYTKTTEVINGFGGLFHPKVGPDLLGKEVPLGTTLGYVQNPATLEVLEYYTAPYEHTSILGFRSMLSPVHPGTTLYVLGELPQHQIN